MKKNFFQFTMALICLVFFSCGNKSGTSVASVAQKWCDLNGKVDRAATDAEKEAAKAARENYEQEMDAKYGKDEAMKQQIADEIEKCENASEGK